MTLDIKKIIGCPRCGASFENWSVLKETRYGVIMICHSCRHQWDQEYRISVVQLKEKENEYCLKYNIR